MTSPITIAIVVLLPIVFIGIGYYFDFKQDRKGFIKTVIGLSIAIILSVMSSSLIDIGFEYIFPDK